ncbi:MAG TPA: hypothetical protein VKE22_06165 [Haliangiales bacterium]|nr:hypothetical protein [Haliangiales bacterium]
MRLLVVVLAACGGAALPPPPVATAPSGPFRVVDPPGGRGAAYPVVRARVFALGDSQFHHLYGKRSFAQSPFADRYQGIEVAIRPAALDDGSDLLLEAFLDEHRAAYAASTLVYMGDAADLSCQDEYDRFFALAAAAGIEPLLMVASNHDGFYVGNYTQKADANGNLAYTDMPTDWRRACARPGTFDDRILTKAQAVTRIAENLPDGPLWATDFAAFDPTDPSGYRTAYLTYARPIGDAVWGLFLDTVDYRDLELTRTLGAGTVGALSAAQLNGVDKMMLEVALAAGAGLRPSFVAFGHHTIAELDAGTRDHLFAFLDGRPEILAYVSAHTHRPDEHLHRLPSGRMFPELVVGSTTDFGSEGEPPSARLVEVREDPATGRRGVASTRLYLDVDALCGDVVAVDPEDPLAYTAYRLARDDTPDVPTSTAGLLLAWIASSDLKQHRVAQLLGALVVEHRMVRALASLYLNAPGGVDDEAARAELVAVVSQVGTRPPLSAPTQYELWWDPALFPAVPEAARTLLSFGAERATFESLRATRTTTPARRRYFACHAARAAEAEARSPRRVGGVLIR